jgi:hypothetical protein
MGKRAPNARARHTKAEVLLRLPQHDDAGPPPLKLTGPRRKLYDELRARYALTTTDEALVRSAAESLERAAALADLVDREGAVLRDRFGGAKPHPAILLERDFRAAAARTLAALSARFEE